jgi:hypothetical protein
MTFNRHSLSLIRYYEKTLLSSLNQDTRKVHTTRQTAVRLHKKGASPAEVGRFLGHESLKTTSEYLEEQQEGYASPFALGEEFGIRTGDLQPCH